MTAGLRDLWQRALREHSTPREIAFAVALGAFVAFTPFIGFHIWIALGLASLLRLNRLWAVLASHISPPPVFLTVSFLEIEFAHRLRTGAWVPMAVHEVATHGRELIVDWLLGTPAVAGPIAACVGVGAYFAARRAARATARATVTPLTPRKPLTPRSPAGPPPPSSESPPSGPPAPTV
jgi:uncharacterized protein